MLEKNQTAARPLFAKPFFQGLQKPVPTQQAGHEVGNRHKSTYRPGRPSVECSHSWPKAQKRFCSMQSALLAARNPSFYQIGGICQICGPSFSSEQVLKMSCHASSETHRRCAMPSFIDLWQYTVADDETGKFLYLCSGNTGGSFS